MKKIEFKISPKTLPALIIGLVMVTVIFSGCSNSQKTLTIYTWADMFPPEILQSFEKETGYRINYVNFDQPEEALARLEASGGKGYDLVINEDYVIQTTIQSGLAQRLDKSRLVNYRNINPLYQKQFYDPLDQYSIPYGAGVQTILYDPARVSIDITGYADLWDESLRNNIGIIDYFRVINGMALKVLGISYNTEEIGDIQRAGELLVELAPNIRLMSNYGLEEDLLAGEISAGIMFTENITRAMMENPNLKVVFPKEGVGFGVMAAFIPSEAPNPDAAYAFLNYIMDAERGASCFEYLGYYSTFSASDPYIDDEYRAFLTLPENFNIDSEMIQNVSQEALDEHQRVWTIFRQAAGQSN